MPELAMTEPDLVRVQVDPRGGWSPADGSSVLVDVVRVGAGLRVRVATAGEVSRLHLRWHRPAPAGSLVLGDAWERSYGDLEWRPIRAEACLPWMALVHAPDGTTAGYGVEVRGGAFAFWTVDDRGLGLWLDLRSGGAPVRPGDRPIDAAVVRAVDGEPGPFATQRALARLLCRDPLPDPGPLVGANNWYYAYGRDFDLAAVVRDARLIAELAGPHPVRPFGVIDDGWSPDGTADGRAASAGPWDEGRSSTFPSMPAAAAALAAEGVRPGIWYRPLLRRDEPALGSRGPRDGAWALDPSVPGVLAQVEDDIARLVDWGFELVKHDFSTYDLLGRWGWGMGASPAGATPPLADPSRSTAEVLGGFYRALLAGSGDAVVLGCDVVGHLAAGLQHAQRTGDDTSGHSWDRTRRVGVNTLAFRLAQHGSFFTVDPDCVPSTPATPWAQNRQLLDLVARSGTALFVSVDPASRTPEVDADLAAAIRLALDGGTPGGVEPLDQLTSPTPSHWRDATGEHRYRWVPTQGADPFESVFSATPV